MRLISPGRHGIRRWVQAGRTARSDLGQPEIEYLGVPALGDKDVGRFDVAVDNALRMRGVQSLGNLRRKRKQGFVIQRLSRNQRLQRHAIQKLHGNERLLTVLSDFVDGTDIGMIKSGRRTRLPAKPFQRLRVSRQFVG